VTIATDRRPPGLRVHHSRLLRVADVATERGLRVTSPARTVLDIAPRLTDRRLARVINDLRLRNLVTIEALAVLTDRLRTRPGARRIRAIIGASHPEPTRSPFEDDWITFARRHRLPVHEMNVHVCGHRVDVLFPDRLIVELDGWQTHRTSEAFEADRARDAEILARTGIPTIRITQIAFRLRPAEHARRIRQVLKPFSK
jgi:very-short-patch-repair endonuclease